LSRTLVIRFGALGDLCLLAWSLAALARAHAAATGRDRAAGGPVADLVTKSAYADLLARVPGVGEVHALAGPGLWALARLASRLRDRRIGTVIDAHGSLRSRVLLGLMRRRAARRLAKDTADRLALLFLRRRGAGLGRSMRDRFDAALGLPGAGAGDPRPRPPLAGLAPAIDAAGPRLGLAPGARWDSKRWPDARFAEFLHAFRSRRAAPVRIFLGPQEEAWFGGSALAAAAAELPGVEIRRDRALTEVAAGLGGCATLLTNDSGLLHLAEAVGTPVLALFGPTVREFGYYPQLPGSRVLELPLPCRPCSRNGKRPCWRQDRACLADIPAARVLEELLRMLPWAGSATEGGAVHA
jgi:heptosyltransferase-2